MLPATASMTVMLLTVAYYALRRQTDHNYFVNVPIPVNGSYFDFIIVGGGTAGCILAHRLSTRLNASILMLEAGGPQSVITDMIGNTQYLIGGEFDWNYHVQQQHYAGLAYPNFTISRGKVLGGTSTTQWGIYNRGNPNDYDNWSQRYGLTNMTWDMVLPFFLAYENNTDSSLRFNGYHRSGGLVSVSTETEPDPVLLNFRTLMNTLGFSTIDLNGGTQNGTAIAQMFYNADTGIKSTTANSYIESINQTARITITTRAFVERILFTNNTHASGVVFTRNGTEYHMFANNEVILTAGPINTPQVLMLSGIGPRIHLQELNIPLVRNLPVGNNLHDQVFVPLYYRVNNETLRQVDPYPRFDVANLYGYFHNASGPLAHHADGVTYYSSSQNSNATSWPDTMIISVVEFFNNLNATVSQYASNTEQWRRYWTPYANDGYYLAIDPVLARPTSRGTVRLNATDPRSAPLIDPNYLSNQTDFEALLDVTMFVVRALQRYPLPGVMQFPPIPGCPIVGCLTETLCEMYLRCHIRQLARSYYNFAGTARMGLANDTAAVVDPQFRVIGFDNLRVVDASVVPEVPNGHIIAATIMLGEKASNLIGQDYQ
ncbi:glucose dehydrogenase-like protein [Dermatophagoides farinae]|uniref:Glucose dehydrogenase-like protein n=1 Tax=Dermatophagoides farinae TaxID=6954 RepID=A0A9D4P8H1_DERFA|nr:glucose dehydrogenase-like protein [Dermatophagoides farinae]